jgi:Tfp pilus assembly protein PilO
MPEWPAIGKLLIAIGSGIIVLGLLLLAGDRIPGVGTALSWFGKLPGDLSFKRDDVSVYFPLATSIVISILLSLVFVVLGWFFRR